LELICCQEFSTGAVRDVQEGKGKYHLLPPRAMRRLAQHYEHGAIKYGDGNWLLGMPLSRFIDSGLRHVFKMLQGLTDEDHAAAAVWNFAAVIEIKEMIDEGLLPKELDDVFITQEQKLEKIREENRKRANKKLNKEEL